MYFSIIDLFQDLGKYQRILIYGTGSYAMNIFRIMKEFNLSEKVFGFVVSIMKNAEDRYVEGIPIFTLDQIERERNDTVILVAVSNLYSDEIKECLQQRNLSGNSFFLIDYLKKENLENWDKSRSFLELYRYIVQWCLSHQIQGVDGNIGFGNLIKYIPEKKDLQAADGRLIIFIVGMITARTSRIVIALKKIGYQVKILKWQSNNEYVGEAEVRHNNIEIINCIGEEDIMFWAYKENPLIFCIDPPWERNVISRLMLFYKDYFGKIVMAPYDVLNFTHFRGKEQNFIFEKYALENADGVVWRYFSKTALQEVLGFKYRGDSIDFLDYCSEYNVPLKNSRSDVLKLCCLPTHTKPFLQNVKEDFGLAREATVHEIMDKIGIRQDCEFHVFLWELPDKEDIETLKRIRRQYPNFYYYAHIDHEILIRRISEYDYGCVLSIDGAIPEWPNTLNVGLEPYYTEGAYKYAAQNKFYDFLNAHLPIIATYPIKLIEVLSEYKVIIDMSLEKLDVDFLKANRHTYYQNAVKAHEELLVDKHIFKLVDFFNKIYRGKM